MFVTALNPPLRAALNTILTWDRVGSLVPFRLARMVRGSSRPLRTGSCVGLAALLISLGCNSLENAIANGDTRTLSFHNTHTNEDLTVTFKVNGRYDDDALAKINHILRDFREDKPVKMDPHLMDLVGGLSRVWAAQPSPSCADTARPTTAMLRRSSGVAKLASTCSARRWTSAQASPGRLRGRAAGTARRRRLIRPQISCISTPAACGWPRMPEAHQLYSRGPLSARRPQRAQPASVSIPIRSEAGGPAGRARRRRPRPLIRRRAEPRRSRLRPRSRCRGREDGRTADRRCRGRAGPAAHARPPPRRRPPPSGRHDQPAARDRVSDLRPVSSARHGRRAWSTA